MTIKGLQKLASQHPGSLIIINELAGGEIVRQYISVWGQGVYPADGLPTLDEESILALLDVPTDKRKSWTVKSVPMEGMWARILEDNAEGDKEAMELPVLTPIGLTREHSYWTRELISNEKTGEKSMLLIVKLGYQLAAAISLRERWAEEEKNLKALRQIHQAAEDIYNRKKADDEES